MGTDGGMRAPTVVIDPVLVVRPIKVVGLLCGVIALFFLMLSAAATAWVRADNEREGLWERCNYTAPEELECDIGHYRGHEWISACQALSMIALACSLIAIIITAQGLKNDNFRVKYKLYWAGMAVFFVATGFELISLIVFPVKFLNEEPHRADGDWNFGWAYVIGWCAAVSDFAAGLFLLLDRDAEEIVYKERIVQEEEKNGIEATDDV